MPSDTPLFYMYTDRALDFGWMHQCRGFDRISQGSQVEWLGEVYLRRSLARHPMRTWDPQAALLFYVPVWEYTSLVLGPCNGTTHRSRMEAASQALLSSPFYAANTSRNHIWATSATKKYVSSSSFDREWEGLDYRERMAPLDRLLKDSTAGLYKSFCKAQFMCKTRANGCSFEVPYPTTAATATPASKLAAEDGIPRDTLLFFSGSLDVCCTGERVRCAIAKLFGETAHDVRILPSVRNVSNIGPCTQHALDLQNKTASVGVTPVSNSDSPNATAYLSMGKSMKRSIFCLVPPGDTCVTSRLYTSIAAGCIPVVLCDNLCGGFQPQANYTSFWVKWSAARFANRPTELLHALRSMAPELVSRRQRLMAHHSPDILYGNRPHSRTGSNFLKAANECQKSSAFKVNAARGALYVTYWGRRPPKG